MAEYRIAAKEDRKNLSRARGKFDLGKIISWEYGESEPGSERAENKPGRNTLLSILFLDGQLCSLGASSKTAISPFL